MGLTVQFEQRAEYLYAPIRGEFDIQSAMECTGRVMEHCARQKFKKVLIDYRTVTGTITDPERIHYAQDAAEKYFSLVQSGSLSNVRFAFLGKKPQLDPNRLGEAVAVNRGMMMKVTDDIEEAFDWLGVKKDID